MHRLGLALLLACLLVPAAAADDEAAWWAAPPSEEADNGWWHGQNEDVALEGAPEAPAGVASAVGPVATQSVPSFAVAKTGPACDADTGVCDESASLEIDGQEEGDAGDTADGTSLPAEGEETDADDDAAATGTNAAPTSNAAPEDDEPPHNCDRYSKQIYRYLDEMLYAKQHGNESAIPGLKAQIKRLEAQMDRRCPLPPAPNKFAAMMRTLKTAAKLALMAAKYGLI